MTMGRKGKEEESSGSEPEEELSGEEIYESNEEKNEVNERSEVEQEPPTEKKRRKKVHTLSLTRTEDFNEMLNKRGVIYVARVPPKMNPTKVKSLLSDFGTVTRVYLVEEDAAQRKRRRKLTGNATKRYLEGWVEFEDKGVAKHVARSLNMTPISMHKRNAHYGTLFLAWFFESEVALFVPN